MAHIYELSAKELESIIAFVRDDDMGVLATGAIERLYNLCSATGRKLAETSKRSIAKANTLEHRLENYRAKSRMALEQGEYSCTDLDSIEIALAVLYQLQQLKTYRLTRTKFNGILYLMYASWLYANGQRLCIEHPRVNEWGPTFWRASNHLSNLTLRVEYKDWENITQKNPAVANFIKTQTQRYYDMKEKDIIDVIKKSAPYKSGVPKRADDKWTKDFDDREIFAWKESQKSPRK